MVVDNGKMSGVRRKKSNQLALVVCDDGFSSFPNFIIKEG